MATRAKTIHHTLMAHLWLLTMYSIKIRSKQCTISIGRVLDPKGLYAWFGQLLCWKGSCACMRSIYVWIMHEPSFQYRAQGTYLGMLCPPCVAWHLLMYAAYIDLSLLFYLLYIIIFMQTKISAKSVELIFDLVRPSTYRTFSLRNHRILDEVVSHE